MISRRLRDGVQLSNPPSRRREVAFAFLLALTASVVLANLLTRQEIHSHADNVTEVVFLVLAVVLLSKVQTRIERGRIVLAGIGIGAAALLLNPLDATLVGLSLGISMPRRGGWTIFTNAITASSYACFAAVIATSFSHGAEPSLVLRCVVLVIAFVGSWVVVAVGLSLLTGEAILSIVKHNFSGEFYAANMYFGLAALLTSYVLDGSALGYFLATIVFVLSLALTDTIAGRRVRRVLESELSDADRHLFHSRAIEGVVHNLRNHMATAVGYLKEIDPRRLDGADREAIEIATSAANDAVSVLRTLSQGATPKVTYAKEPIDLNDLASRALGMARSRARSKEVELGLRESQETVQVSADPLLMREVITNLVNNAIDAAPDHGHVEISTGRRSNGWPYFSVADNGPGVADENRHHLFEPHFTTKETGTGLGLFMSYGIVREHQGDLTYSGTRGGGATFTVSLPPFK